MTTNFNMEDIIDVREIIERFEELENDRDALREQTGKSEADVDAAANGEGDELDNWTYEHCDELDTLEKLLAELAGYGGDEQWRGDWHPVTLIRDSYFEDYARELVQEIGDMPNGIPHYIEIDWERTARNIRVDYSSVEIDDVTYWYRG